MMCGTDLHLLGTKRSLALKWREDISKEESVVGKNVAKGGV